LASQHSNKEEGTELRQPMFEQNRDIFMGNYKTETNRFTNHRRKMEMDRAHSEK
jgi:hypothetical protein